MIALLQQLTFTVQFIHGIGYVYVATVSAWLEPIRLVRAAFKCTLPITQFNTIFFLANIDQMDNDRRQWRAWRSYWVGACSADRFCDSSVLADRVECLYRINFLALYKHSAAKFEWMEYDWWKQTKKCIFPFSMDSVCNTAEEWQFGWMLCHKNRIEKCMHLQHVYR